MLCPECGYMMDAFDKDCARCHGKGLKKQTAEQIQLPAAPPLSPPASISPAPNHLPATLPQPQPVVVLPSLKPFTCVVCGNESVQKVSAICQSGSWSSTENSTSVSHGHVWGGGNFSVVGNSSSSGSGATNIARALSPPATPTPYSVGCFLFLLFVGVCVYFAGEIGWSVLVVGVGGLMCYRMLDGEQKEMDRWNAQMAKWSGLFYCSRCDNVYNPNTGESASSGGMNSLL